MYFIGYDIGSSSVKASLVKADNGLVAASDYYPKHEMDIIAHQHGWAEQNPEEWWSNLKSASKAVLHKAGINGSEVKAIGITWQMHGLVLIDKDFKVLRPSIIWCDSRAISYGEKAFKAIGEDRCLSHLLNSPGNFTASKLAWVKENEPEIYERIYKFLLPGDYIAMKLSGETGITVEGLSEGIFWDFKYEQISDDILRHYGIARNLFPDIIPVFGQQATICNTAAKELGLQIGTPITYRAGDQPNNALSLNVTKPGEIAATAGTSGVVYGVMGTLDFDTRSRVNTFAHVNHTKKDPRLGMLLCVNGTGILNSWMKRNLGLGTMSYNDITSLAMQSPIGANGISIIPFGNGAERMLENKHLDCSIHGINFNNQDRRDLLRAAQEGISFAMNYGISILSQIGISPTSLRTGYANMFLSPLFVQTLSNISGITIDLFDTDGATGAARAAGYGLQYYASYDEAFSALEKMASISPIENETEKCREVYEKWLSILTTKTNNY
ncbi:xylulokinase [Sphingobacterium faecale]|uniref:Carbohydrate kinase n=1 Tax=Sphingobacterium faecale TaxID=2803775 RepID=A0ABS1R9S8_9SPHI|nr:FGGY family carbohydrate kinase [Sphingobacterium faecale]MBL1411467.1 carbohydrate kinase [Sphingobacterium faecale]